MVVIVIRMILILAVIAITMIVTVVAIVMVVGDNICDGNDSISNHGDA